MRRGTAIIGQKILSLADGRRIEEVKDIVIGPRHQHVIGLLVDEGGLLHSSRLVPIQAVHSFGRDAIVIPDEAAVASASDVPEIKDVLSSDDKLLGKKVYTETGEEQGSVSDLFFEEGSGRIVGLEISRGRLGDVSRGRAYLAVEDIARTGPEVLFVAPPTGDALEGQTGGIQGALDDARSRADDAASRLSDGVQRTGSKLGEGVQSAGGQVSDRAAAAKPEERLIGRRAGRDVVDERGTVIVAAGQSVSPEHVERARAAGRLKDLTGAVAEWETEQAAAGAGDTIDEVGERAGSLWDQFTRRVSEMTDATGRRVDEERTKRRLADIEDSVGRPVTKVILDRNDDVILDLGEIITHEAVQRAHEAGSLDSLLSCVYRGDVTFEKEDLRIGKSGSAAVERATGEAPIIDELTSHVEQAEQERAEGSERNQREAEAARREREREREERANEREQRRQEREQDRARAAADAQRPQAQSRTPAPAERRQPPERTEPPRPTQSRTG